MNPSDLHSLADMRVAEAQALFQRECYAGAYYLAGYAIECSLKAAIAKQVDRHDFPNKPLALKSHTHDLQALPGLSGLQKQFDHDASADDALIYRLDLQTS